ncbi:MAG: FecR family protein [Treponema sp.]|jgi:copper(I)-binding protein|nr:FecR family protein [Treponema sp.]
MQQTSKKRQRFKLKYLLDVLVTLVCLAGAGGGIYLFWNDLNRTMTKQSELPVGTISYKRNSAQRRFQDRLVWGQLQQETPIYNGDIIRTAALSDASITFSDGNVIDLAENCLVQVFFDKDGTRVELASGNMNINAAKGKFTLVSGGNEVKLTEGTVVQLGASEGDEGLNLQVMEGNAALNTIDGTVAEIASGAALSVEADGSAKRNPQVVVLSPTQVERYLTTTDQALPVNFTWNMANFDPSDFVRLEVAEDRNFTRIAASRDSKASALSVNLPPGNYFWRAYVAGPDGPLDTKRLNASTGRFIVLRAIAPLLRAPAAAAEFSFRMNPPPIRFQWSATSTGTEAADVQYLLEVADNAALQNLQLRTVTSGVSYSYSGLEEGSWYWRVTPIYPPEYQGDSAPSTLGTFTIRRAMTLAAPTLLVPETGSVVSGSGDVRGIYFSWKKENDAASYTLQVAEDAEFRNSVLSRSVQDNKYTALPGETAIGTGRYFWRISYTDSEGALSPLSETRLFTAISGTPMHESVYPPDGYTVTDDSVASLRFAWRTNLPFTNRFQIATSTDFSRPIFEETVGGSGTERSHQGIALSAGVYYWRVTVNADAVSLLSQTAVKRLVVAAPLAAPELEQPQGRLLPSPNGNLNFSWRAVSGAGLYEFSLYEGDSSLGMPRIVYQNQNVRQTSLSLPQSVMSREGGYFWTVRAVVEESAMGSKRTSQPEIGRFLLSIPQSVVLESPAPNYTFTGLEALRQPGSIRWTTSENVASSRLIISRNADLGGAAVVDQANPGRTMTMPPLTEGTYYWTIRAESAEGVDISARPLSFRVLPVTISRVSLDFPQTGYTFTGIDALRHPGMALWSSEERVGTSRFILSRTADLSGTPVLELVNPSRTITLPQLTEGTYYWTIRAESPDSVDISAATPMSVRVLPVEAPRVTLDAPVTGYRIAGLQALRQSETVRWSSSGVVGASTFVISQNADLSGAPVFEVANPGRTITLPRLTEGTYYWTIRAESPEGIDISAAAPRSFQVLPVDASRVTLDAPTDGYRIAGVQALRQTETVRWSVHGSVLNSRFILSRAADLSGTPVLEITDPGRTITLPRLTEGTYYWTIRAESPEGIDISAAAPRSFQVLPIEAARVTLDAPAAGARITGLQALRQTESARWSVAGEVLNSRFILSSNADLSGTPLLEIVNPGRTITLPRLIEGTYYWTIRAESPEGIDISAAAPRSFQVLPIEAARVSLDFPANNAAYSGLDALRHPGEVRWSASDPVSSSRFVLSRNANPLSGTPVLEINNPGRFITLPRLTEGTYYWTIEAKTAEGIDISASAPFSFRVLAPTPTRVTLLDNGRRFTVTETTRNLAVLHWTSLEKVGTSRFVLSRSATPLTGQPLIDTANPATAIALPRLEPGTYYWTIQATTTDGLDISATTAVSFQVLAAARIVLDTPTEGFAYEGLAALRLPGTLRWSSSESVGRARLVISRSEDVLKGESVLDIGDPPRSITLPRLTAGVYYWTVQAETPDGLDISAAKPSSFRVLPVPLLEMVKNGHPMSGSSFTPEQVQREKRIVFMWEPVNGANTYILTLAPADNPAAPLINAVRLSTYNYSIDITNLYSGAFIWRVEAIFMAADGTIEQRGQVMESRFTITVPPITNPQLNTPAPVFGN